MTESNQSKQAESKLERLADQLAAAIAQGSSDYGSKRNLIKKLLLDFAEEIKRQAVEP